MADEHDRHVSRLSMAYDHAVRSANRETINPMIPELSLNDILPLMVSVARARGSYLAEAFAMTGKSEASSTPDPDRIARLRSLRETYEELLAVSQALENAIERGYLDVQGI